jgi:hypothetical protein
MTMRVRSSAAVTTSRYIQASYHEEQRRAGDFQLHQQTLIMERLDILGASVALLIFGLVSAVFIARLAGRPDLGHWFGFALLLLAVPLVYLLVKARAAARSPLYYVQICLMLFYLVVEALLDYVFRINFREVRWMVVTYVTLFFGATGGMIGVASLAGRSWTLSAVLLFLGMAALAFIQRAKTGM